jgi:hypothetical protein
MFFIIRYIKNIFLWILIYKWMFIKWKLLFYYIRIFDIVKKYIKFHTFFISTP